MEPIVVYLGLGSNLGERESNLLRGIDLLQEKMSLFQVSRMLETEPWGYTDQPGFLNCVCQGETSLTPKELLSWAKDVEASLGREPTFANGPRILDVDILFYGNQVISEAGLEIPHPRLTQRGFVLVPLAEIAPKYRHPALGITVSELLRNLNDTLVVNAIRPWLPKPAGTGMEPV